MPCRSQWRRGCSWKTSHREPRCLAEQGGRIALLSDEGGVFDMMAGRYARQGILNLDVYLKAGTRGTCA